MSNDAYQRLWAWYDSLTMDEAARALMRFGPREPVTKPVREPDRSRPVQSNAAVDDWRYYPRRRRSRIDWDNYLPRDVAIKQIAWERGATVLAMRRAGMTFADIAQRFDVTTERARQIALKAERVMRDERLAPAERYLMAQRMAPPLLNEPRGCSPGRLFRLSRALDAFAYSPNRDWLIVASMVCVPASEAPARPHERTPLSVGGERLVVARDAGDGSVAHG